MYFITIINLFSGLYSNDIITVNSPWMPVPWATGCYTGVEVKYFLWLDWIVRRATNTKRSRAMTSWRSAWASWRACQRGTKIQFKRCSWNPKRSYLILYCTCILVCILVICHPLRCFIRLYTLHHVKSRVKSYPNPIQFMFFLQLWLQPCLSLQVVLFQLGFQLSFGTHLFPEATWTAATSPFKLPC